MPIHTAVDVPNRVHLPEILAGLTDDELATWPGVLSKGGLSAGGLVSLAKSDNAGLTPPLVFDGIFHGIDAGDFYNLLIVIVFLLKTTIEWE